MTTVKRNLSNTQVTLLVLLRLSIGWHFFYEGLIKLLNPGWTSVGYLMDSKGFMSEFFQSLAANPTTIQVVDFLNIWGLIAIGLGLILGAFTKIAKIAGILLLSFYYLSHPPFLSLEYLIPTEGNYFIINKTLIELLAIAVLLVFPTSKILGFDRVIFKK